MIASGRAPYPTLSAACGDAQAALSPHYHVWLVPDCRRRADPMVRAGRPEGAKGVAGRLGAPRPICLVHKTSGKYLQVYLTVLLES